MLTNMSASSSSYGTVDEESHELLEKSTERESPTRPSGVAWSTRVVVAVLCLLSIGVLISSAGRDMSELSKKSELATASVAKPNVIFVMVDDAGWADFGYHSTDLKYATPNIDRLSAGGVRIENYYTDTVCTPSRASKSVFYALCIRSPAFNCIKKAWVAGLRST